MTTRSDYVQGVCTDSSQPVLRCDDATASDKRLVKHGMPAEMGAGSMFQADTRNGMRGSFAY